MWLTERLSTVIVVAALVAMSSVILALRVTFHRQFARHELLSSLVMGLIAGPIVAVVVVIVGLKAWSV